MSSNAHCSLNHSQNQNPVSENKLHCGNIYKLSSNRIRDLMNHEMPYEAPVVSKQNIHLDSKLKLGYHKETPENFYKTTNNKFYNEPAGNRGFFSFLFFVFLYVIFSIFYFAIANVIAV